MNMKTDNRIYIVSYAPMPGRFESEIELGEILQSDSYTKVFTDFTLAKDYYEKLHDVLCEDGDDLMYERIHLVTKLANE